MNQLLLLQPSHKIAAPFQNGPKILGYIIEKLLVMRLANCLPILGTLIVYLLVGTYILIHICQFRVLQRDMKLK